ncbi:MAG: hypothetical protein AAGH64_07690 [Planctomycetota bacterium]
MQHPNPNANTQTGRSVRSAGFGAAIALAIVALLSPISSTTNATGVPNLPNASAQRLAMIDAIEDVDDRLAKLEKFLSEGKLVVKISELPEITVAE